jgi:MoxR-like ATPase
MEMTGTTALALAQTAFGQTARIRTIKDATDLSTKYRVAYIPDNQTTPSALGYGPNWEAALQMAFVSQRGVERISQVAPVGMFSFQVDPTKAELNAVTVCAGEDSFRFEYENHPAQPGMEKCPVNAAVKVGANPMVPVPNGITYVAPSPATPAAPSATVSGPVAAKTSIPRAFVNPANIKTGLLGWDDDVTPAAVLAAITGEHLLIVGPPGNAKSLFARRFTAHFEGSLFETQLSKYSDETALFGAPNLKRLREDGVFEYPKHGIAACDWAFLDEFFDASDVLMRTTLGILQEKKFTKGGHEEDIPLQTCIATANYTRVNDITAAVVDRFAITVTAPVLTKTQREMLYSKTTFEDVPAVQYKVGLDQLRQMRANSKEVEIPRVIIKALVSWCEEMGFTPRRERKLAAIIRASATLNGRKTADEEDIMAARYCVPISASGKVEDGRKALQPLRDAIKQQLHEGEQLARMGKLAQPIGAASQKADDLLAAVKATKLRLSELRAFQGVSEKVNAAREAAVTTHEAGYQELLRLLDM